MPVAYGPTTLDTSAADNVILGQYEAVTKPGTMKSGSGVVTRGTVLGIVTATGKLKPYASGNSDGSEVPVGIQLVTVDATSGDIVTAYWIKGVFNSKGLTGADANAIALLQPKGIIIKTGVD